LREIWDDAAIYVDPHNSDSLKTELLRLIQNEPYRREMSRRARQRALLYSSELMAKKYLRAYSDLLVQLQPRHRQEKLAQCA